MAIASTILDKAERTLGFDRSSIGIPALESTNLLSVLNEAVKEYFASFDKSGEPSDLLKAEKGYTIVADTAVNNGAGVADGATSIIVDDSSGLGSSGVVALWGSGGIDYAAFGANNLTTTLSTVTGVNYAHDDNEVVSLLYALPSNYDSPRTVRGSPEGILVNDAPFYYTSGQPTGNKYTIYDNGTTKYIHLPKESSGDVFIHYNKTPTEVTAEGTTVDIPTKDQEYAVWKVIEYAAPILERNDIFQIAQLNVLKFLNSAHVRKNIGKRPRVRPLRSTTYYQLYD